MAVFLVRLRARTGPQSRPGHRLGCSFFWQGPDPLPGVACNSATPAKEAMWASAQHFCASPSLATEAFPELQTERGILTCARRCNATPAAAWWNFRLTSALAARPCPGGAPSGPFGAKSNRAELLTSHDPLQWTNPKMESAFDSVSPARSWHSSLESAVLARAAQAYAATPTLLGSPPA